MEFQKLLNLDSNLKTVDSNEANTSFDLRGISDTGHLRDATICFVARKKFFDDLVGQLKKDSAKKIILIFDEKYFNQAKTEILENKFANQMLLFATTSNFDSSLTKISEVFFQESIGKLDWVTDGRKDLSAKVNSTSKIAENVFIGCGCSIGKNCLITAGVVIGPNSTIGDNVTIYPGVKIYNGVHIGNNCRIHSGTIIGADGYGYRFIDGKHCKIWHMGGVIIEDNVEIGANVTIDAGTFSPTKVGNGTKVDNLVQIAHNCQVGTGAILCGKSGLAGSVTLGNFCVLGGDANIAPDVVLEDGTQVAGSGQVTKGGWGPGAKIAGHPARPLREWLKTQALLRKLSS